MRHPFDIDPLMFRQRRQFCGHAFRSGDNSGESRNESTDVATGAFTFESRSTESGG